MPPGREQRVPRRIADDFGPRAGDFTCNRRADKSMAAARRFIVTSHDGGRLAGHGAPIRAALRPSSRRSVPEPPNPRRAPE